jgi:cell division protein FtsZ
MIHFDLPKDKSSIIKVIGVGGGGSNAVNHMFSQGIEGVNFIICNTDAQAIAQSKVPNKVQLGPHLTQGLGAGANPIVGRQATEESLEEIKKILEVNTKMVFVTAGMGGGTGTGGAPIVSKICKEMDILTVGIVTTPFGYEGKKRMLQAEEGINQLKEHVDTLLVINNDKLRHQFGNLKMSEAFAKADNILATAAKCITDVITGTGQINVDFADVCTVMRNGGVAILGNAAVAGENRAQNAIEEALNSPLLNDNDIRGAKWILVNINSTEGEFEHTMDEVEIIQNYIMEHAGEDTDVILGLGFDSSLGDKLSITLIATGFEQKNPFVSKTEVIEAPKPKKIVMTLGVDGDEVKMDKDFIAIKPEVITEEVVVDTMAPQLVVTEEVKPEVVLFQPTQPIAEVKVVEPIIEKLVLQLEPVQPEIKMETKPVEEVVVAPINFLAKPTNIYDENVMVNKVEPIAIPKQENIVEWDMPTVVTSNNEAEQPEELVMELIIKEEKVAPVISIMVEEPIVNSEVAMQENVLASATNEQQEVEEDSLTKAAERTKKLRNLSFNFDSAEADTFENEPAYLRRKNEIHNTLANVEKFYSNYTVSVDDNNEAKINTNSKNSFLEGEKPD